SSVAADGSACCCPCWADAGTAHKRNTPETARMRMASMSVSVLVWPRNESAARAAPMPEQRRCGAAARLDLAAAILDPEAEQPGRREHPGDAPPRTRRGRGAANTPGRSGFP